ANAYSAPSATTRPRARTSGPSDIAAAKTTTTAKNPTGDASQARSARRWPRKANTITADRNAAAIIVRPALAILISGRRTPNRGNNTSKNGATNTGLSTCTIAVSANTAIVSPGNSAPSAFGHARAIDPHTWRLGSAVKYAKVSAENLTTSGSGRAANP